MGKLVHINNAKVYKDVETGETFMQCGCGSELTPMGGGAASWNDLKDKPFDSEVVKMEGTVYEESFSVTIIDREYLPSVSNYELPLDANDIPNYEDSYVVITYESEVVPKREWVFDKATKGYDYGSSIEPSWESSADSDSGIYISETNFKHVAEISCKHGGIPVGDTGTLTFAIKYEKDGEKVKTIDPKYLPNTGGTLVVELNYDDNTVITPYDEIHKAMLNGIAVMCIGYNDAVYYLTDFTIGGNGKLTAARFVSILPFNSCINVIELDYEHNWSYTSFQCELTSGGK